MSPRLYPELNKKEPANQVVCLLCSGLDPYDNELDSYCVPGKKNIQPDQVGEPRVCRRFTPK